MAFWKKGWRTFEAKGDDLEVKYLAVGLKGCKGSRVLCQAELPVSGE